MGGSHVCSMIEFCIGVSQFGLLIGIIIVSDYQKQNCPQEAPLTTDLNNKLHLIPRPNSAVSSKYEMFSPLAKEESSASLARVMEIQRQAALGHNQPLQPGNTTLTCSCSS